MQVKVYWASDDLIEVEGGLSQEFDCYASGKTLVFSDGTELLVEYGDDGCWHIKRTKEGAATYSHMPNTGSDEDYTDRVTLDGDLQWVECWGREGPTHDEVVEAIQEFDSDDWGDLDRDELLAIYRKVKAAK